MYKYYRLTPYELTMAIDFKEWEDLDNFQESYKYCLENGQVWGCFKGEGEVLVGLGMWFEYKKSEPRILFILEKNDVDSIDKLLQDGTTAIFLPYLECPVEVKREMIKKILEDCHGKNFITKIPGLDGWSEGTNGLYIK